MATPPDGEEESGRQGAIDDFHVTLDAYQGPFDLLLSLISKHELDITEVALAEVTDEFITYMHDFPDLSRTTEFLVTAATLLDLKSARLLPAGPDDHHDNEEELEARDLLFSRLLRYRAFKEAAAAVGTRLEEYRGSVARSVELEPRFAALLPELEWATSPADLARRAADALTRVAPTVRTSHLLELSAPVADQSRLVVATLKERGEATFEDLVADAATMSVVVARFLALLELFRREAVEFAQERPLGVLTVRWIGGDEDVEVEDEYVSVSVREGAAGE